MWVGGQLTLAGLVPGLRAISPEAPRVAARRFARIAWTAYAVLVVTGIWNIVVVDPVWDSSYGTTLSVKIAVVVVSGVSAAVHSVSTTPRARAVWGALAVLVGGGGAVPRHPPARLTCRPRRDGQGARINAATRSGRSSGSR